MKEYYDRRAPEYDDWYVGRGLYAERDRPGWAEEMTALIRTLETLTPARTLDVACGTGFLTRHLPGEVAGLDQSPSMLEIAARQAPGARFVQGDALALSFPDGAFERVFTGAPELVVDASQAHSPVPEEWQPRVLNDGSRWRVYKRYFTADGLAGELGGGDVLHAGRWFVAVQLRSDE